MSDSVDARTPEQRLQDEAARWRKTLREEQARHAATRTALRDANRLLLRAALHERLADPRDFDVYVGIDSVTDAGGRLVWPRVFLLVDALTAERPHLATPRRLCDADPEPSALPWLPSEHHQRDSAPQEPRGHPASDQGSAGTDRTDHGDPR
ncbi:hypothetical protein [Microbacterium sp.]|uniref:hypothetical protein n=1 Tax=Microbacterium sp. TaxID=51671 RepID=UPI0035661EE2